MADVGHFGCPKFTFDRISGHFRSIGHFGFPKFTFDLAISDRYRIYLFFRRPFWMSENHFRWHFWPFQIHTELLIFFYFLTKWPPAAILDGTTMSIIELVRDIWMSNACVKFEEHDSLNPLKVIALTKLCGGGGPRGGGCVADEKYICAKILLYHPIKCSVIFIKIESF